ncbi:MAG: DUF3039 domain-containing protein [Acidimicrobiales bacterium]
MASTSPVVRPVATPVVDDETRTTDGDGDHDRFAHYVPKSELTRALIEGVAVIALCGKKWVPCRDPERYPVCPTCKEVLAALKSS